MKKIVVAIDGHSSCGKSTIAKDLARATGYTYIDSGAMYRAVTLYSLEHGFFKGDAPDLESLRQALPDIHISFQPNPETGRSETYLNGRRVEPEIRSMRVADKVSPVAAVDFVRTEMVKQQQALGREKGIVMDGRDIGTVVFPEAELKLFITASPEIRAQRRLKELTDKGEKTTLEEVLHNLSKRDYIDSTRKDGPLKKADDAIVIDNSHLTVPEQNRKVRELFEEIAQK
ncbi:MAG: (d)CMP kinase [Dysgonamonadaceae bacterium]|jgi:cytidylate kinase|nr:(d)CMP kinase [Dysgonamonadaceae bacterium]